MHPSKDDAGNNQAGLIFKPFDLGKFEKRLLVEYRLLKASTRHTVFGLTYLLVLTWLTITHRPQAASSHRASLFRMGLGPQAESESSFTDFAEWTSGVSDGLTSSSDIQSWMSVIQGSKRRLGSCDNSPLSDSLVALQAMTDRNTSCLSESDESYVNSSCVVNGSCVGLCVSHWTEIMPPACFLQHANTSLFQSESLVILNESFKLKWNPLLASISVDFVIKDPTGEMLSLAEVNWSYSQMDISLTVLRKREPVSIPWIGACLGACMILLLFDVKNIYKKAKCAGKFRWWKFLKLIHSFALPSIIAVHWIANEYYMNPEFVTLSQTSQENGVYTVPNLKNLIFMRNGADCLVFLLLLSASYRLFRILSGHPKSAVLYEIVVSRRWEMFNLALSLGFVLIYCSMIWWFVKGKQIAQSLVQTPFGVWPSIKEKDHAVVLIVFGLISFHFLAVVFQVIVTSGFKQYRETEAASSLALSFHEDVWYALKRCIARKKSCYRWPHRLVLLLALENLKAC